MIRRHRLAMAVAAALVALGVGEKSLPAVPPDQERRVAELRKLGGTVFERDGIVVEVNLNRTGVWLDDTHITDATIATLAGLGTLEDLYVLRTDLTIEGVHKLKRLRPGCRIYFRSDQEPE